MKLSVVVNTINEEKNLARCLESVKSIASEIIVVDMHSIDRTVEIAKKYKAKVYYHPYTRFVEPARNFAISKAKGDWLLILDADEELPQSLATQLEKIMAANQVDYVEMPRKNIIFSKWITTARWWPDNLVRFFRKGTVTYSDKIHVPPILTGQGLTLEPLEENALIHHSYQSISQYLDRLNRYTDIQAEEKHMAGTKSNWQDLITKPTNEFISRFFFGKAYEDGIHGLALSLLQAFSELIVLLKLWEKNGQTETVTTNVDKVIRASIRDVLFWLITMSRDRLVKAKLKLARFLLS